MLLSQFIVNQTAPCRLIDYIGLLRVQISTACPCVIIKNIMRPYIRLSELKSSRFFAPSQRCRVRTFLPIILCHFVDSHEEQYTEQKLSFQSVRCFEVPSWSCKFLHWIQWEPENSLIFRISRKRCVVEQKGAKNRMHTSTSKVKEVWFRWRTFWMD
jgi:hypothetical protein